MRKHERHRMLLNAILAIKEFYIFDSTPGDTSYYEYFSLNRVSQQVGNHYLDGQTGIMILTHNSAIGFYLSSEELSKYSKIKLLLFGSSGGGVYDYNQVSAFGASQIISESTSAQEYVFDINTSAANFITIVTGSSGTVNIVSVILE